MAGGAHTPRIVLATLVLLVFFHELSATLIVSTADGETARFVTSRFM